MSRKYLFSILISLLIISCSNNENVKVRKDFRIKTFEELDRAKAGELGVKTRKKVLYLVDEKTKTFKSEGKIGETIFWDENGNLSKIERYNTFGQIHTKWEYEYDSKNRKIKLQSFKEDGRMALEREMEYDNNDNEIKRQERRDEKGVITFEYKTYNEFGQITKHRMEDRKGELIGEETYEYEDHLLTEIINTNINGDELGRREFQYDDRGNLIADIRIRGEQTMNRIDYEYDLSNNLTKINFGFYYTLFKYNEKKQVVMEQIFLENNKRQKKVTISYTDKGLIDEIIDYSPLDEIRHKFKYESEFY